MDESLPSQQKSRQFFSEVAIELILGLMFAPITRIEVLAVPQTALSYHKNFCTGCIANYVFESLIRIFHFLATRVDLRVYKQFDLIPN